MADSPTDDSYADESYLIQQVILKWASQLRNLTDELGAAWYMHGGELIPHSYNPADDVPQLPLGLVGQGPASSDGLGCAEWATYALQIKTKYIDTALNRTNESTVMTPGVPYLGNGEVIDLRNFDTSVTFTDTETVMQVSNVTTTFAHLYRFDITSGTTIGTNPLEGLQLQELLGTVTRQQWSKSVTQGRTKSASVTKSLKVTAPAQKATLVAVERSQGTTTNDLGATLQMDIEGVIVLPDQVWDSQAWHWINNERDPHFTNGDRQGTWKGCHRDHMVTFSSLADLGAFFYGKRIGWESMAGWADTLKDDLAANLKYVLDPTSLQVTLTATQLARADDTPSIIVKDVTDDPEAAAAKYQVPITTEPPDADW